MSKSQFFIMILELEACFSTIIDVDAQRNQTFFFGFIVLFKVMNNTAFFKA